MTEPVTVAPLTGVTDEELGKLYDARGGFSGMLTVPADSTPEPEIVSEEKVAEETVVEAKAEEVAKDGVAQAETAGEETAEESKAPVSEEHKESSKLGRKLKGLSDQVSELKETILKLTATPQPSQTTPETGIEQRLEVPEIISTADDVRQLIAADTANHIAETKKYESQFAKKFEELCQSPLNKDNEVFSEFWANHNTKLSNDPVKDAEDRYKTAKLAVLQKKLDAMEKSPKLPERTVAAKAPAGPATKASANPVNSAAVLPKMDKNTQHLVEHFRREGLSEEKILTYFQ